MTININENFQRPDLPQTIIWPTNPDDIPWFMMRLYEQMTQAINNKDFGPFQMAIGTSATPIQNIPDSGSFILCISGEPIVTGTTFNYWRTKSWAITKTSPTANGVATLIGEQAGTGTLIASDYTISYATLSSNSTSTFVHIRHNVPNVTGSFNIRIIGTK